MSISIRFDTLAEVKIYHHYYKSKVSEDFVVAPTISCQRVLRNYGLLYRQTNKGFVLLYEVAAENNGEVHPLKPMEENVRLSFVLLPKNPFLLNYSNLSLNNPVDHIYYLNNLNDNQQSGQLLLTASTSTEFISQKDSLELKPQLFQYSFESANTSVDIEILDEFSNPVSKKRVVVVQGSVTYLVDLRRYGPGKFTLKIDGVQKTQFYASDELIGTHPFGLIDLFRHDTVASAYRFTDSASNHDVMPKTYAVKIDNRMTYWKYYLVLKYRLKNLKPDQWPADWPNDWSIAYPPDPAVTIAPQPLEVQTCLDGLFAVPFVSDTELPLQQEPIKGVQLKKTGGSGNGSGIREIENLPNPSVTTIVPDSSDNKVYSETFIYI